MTQYVSLIPKASNLLPAFQQMGYSETMAIADLIDNCISAHASEIYVDLKWNGDGKYSEIIIRDNGYGLSANELIKAMEISTDLDRERENTDLGRFGMGLKTASLALGRRMTLISKKDGDVSDARWDIDDLGADSDGKHCEGGLEHGWVISIDNDDEKTQCWKNRLNTQSSGTVLLIEHLNVNTSEKYRAEAVKKFNSLIQKTESHLAIVFHRFLEDKENPITIFVNDKMINPWNPVSPHKKDELEPEEIKYDGYNYVIRKYVLSSPQFLSDEEINAAAGIDGWNRNQGIYVYRNNRLIIRGNWLGYCKKDPAYHLARITIDIPATSESDRLWNIDIKKSRVSVPEFMDTKVKRAVRDCTNHAAKRWNSRGQYTKRNTGQKYVGVLWEEKKSPNTGYYIDRTNPLLRNIMNDMPKETQKKLNSYLLLLENSYPAVQTALLEKQPNADSAKDNVSDNEEMITLKSDIVNLISSLKSASIPNDEIRAVIERLPIYRQFKDNINEIFTGLRL